MTERIEFTRNYSDLSTRRGFQFEFFCDRCGSGFRTPFKTSVTGTVTELLDTAGSMFGGLFGNAADVGERLRSASWQQAKDEAFLEAMEELKPEFIQCQKCLSWVCRKNCWNTKKGLCKDCAPDLGVEMAAAQAARSVEEVWNQAQAQEDVRNLSADTWKESLAATCSKCEAPLPSKVKFCPECGEKLATAQFCAQCGAKLSPENKFCPECGSKAK